MWNVGVAPLIGVNEIREASESKALEVFSWGSTTALQDLYRVAPLVKTLIPFPQIMANKGKFFGPKNFYLYVQFEQS